MIKNPLMLARHLCIDVPKKAVTDDKTRDSTIRHLIERIVFQSTECGAWIEFYPGGISIGSIVEGVEYGTKAYNMNYEFTGAKFDRHIADIEKEAKEIWNDTHGCEDCGPENPDTGYVPINPNCENCMGKGLIT